MKKFGDLENSSEFFNQNADLSWEVQKVARIGESLNHKFFVFFIGLSWLIACSAKQDSKVDCENGSKSVQSAPNALNLSVSYESLLEWGGGYLDIKTKDSAGKVLERRCTMMLTQDEPDPSRIKVWTAIHCLYDAASDEFLNSVYTLQIHSGGRYFPATVKFDRLDNLARFAKVIQPMFSLLPESDKNRWRFSMSNESVKPCQDATQAFKNSLGDRAKNIACFSKNEMRVLSGQVSVDPKYKPLLDNILLRVRAQRSREISHLTEREKNLLKLREKTLSILDHSDLYIRNYAYWINDKHCTLPESDLPLNAQGQAETRKFCPHRESLLNLSRTQFSEEYKIIKPIAEANISSAAELKELHKSIYTCSFSNLDEVKFELDKPLTVCDREQLIRLFWNNYVRDAADSYNMKTDFYKSINGFSPGQYFSIFVNGQVNPSVQRAAWNDGTRLFFLDRNAQEFSPKAISNELVLMNFDNGSFVKLNKTDSGSIFSMMSFVPVGTLSTVDGEPTSGGASILPLPNVTDEQIKEASSPSPSPSSSDCGKR